MSTDGANARYMAQLPIVMMYMAPDPDGWWPGKDTEVKPNIYPPQITISAMPNPDSVDLAELLEAVDDYVRGKAITEEIMQLRTKAAIIRDRMQRRGNP